MNQPYLGTPNNGKKSPPHHGKNRQVGGRYKRPESNYTADILNNPLPVVISSLYLLYCAVCNVHPPLVLSITMFLAIMVCTLYHVSYIAQILGEVFGAVILTLSISSIETAILLNVVQSPELSMFCAESIISSIMIYTTLVGGLCAASTLFANSRGSFESNSAGNRSYTSLILFLYFLCFITPTLVPRSVFVKLFSICPFLCLGLYVLFLYKQRTTHTDYFTSSKISVEEVRKDIVKSSHNERYIYERFAYHLAIMWLGLVCITYLGKKTLISLGDLGLSPRLSLYISSLLVALPEGVSALVSVWMNRAQKSCNLFFGSAIATMAVTLPMVSILSGRIVHNALPTPIMITSLLSIILSSFIYQSGEVSWLDGFILILTHVVYVTVFLYGEYNV